MLVWISACTCLANPTEADYFELTLEELARLQVNIASPKRERIIDTPAITSAYDVADMQNISLNSLEDILNFVPGVVVQDSALGTKAVMIRGIVEAFNQKVLFMLNGIPYWQASHGGIPLLGMSTQYIKRVEIIRGPGAVLFGSNATSGVINVITRSDIQSKMELAYGSNNTSDLSFYGAHQADTVSLHWGGHKNQTDGFNAQYNNRPVLPFYPADTPTNATFNKQQSAQSFWAALNSQSWTINAHHFSSENDGLAAAGSTINQSTLKYSGTLLALEYMKQTDIGDLTYFGDLNNFTLKIPTENLLGFESDGTQQFEEDGLKNNRSRFGIHINRNISDTWIWQSGIEFENRTTGEYQNINGSGAVVSTSMAAHDVNEYSLFSQLDSTGSGYRTIAGFRLTHNESAGTNLLPRLSVVYPIAGNQTIKLLYATAFKSPSFIQQHINIPPNVVKGDPDLEAETVKSTEIAYSAQYGRHLFVVNIYQTHAKDFIFRSVNNNGEVVFSNIESFTRNGLDIDYRSVHRKTQWYANLSWQFEGNQEIDNDPTARFTPEWTLNIGASYQHTQQLSYGASLRHIGQRDVQSALNLLNAQVTYTLPAQYSISLALENILGENMLHPDIQNFQTDTLIQNASEHPTVHGRLSYQF